MVTINSANIYQTPNASGSILYPEQPAFFGYVNTTITDITGDGTAYGPVVFGNELFDQNGDFDTGTGTFTAPISGRYYFLSCIDFGGLTASHTVILMQLVTSNRTYQIFDSTTAIRYTFGGASILRYTGQTYADMDTSDTAYVQIQVSNGTKVVDVRGSGGGATYFSWFSGCLLS